MKKTKIQNIVIMFIISFAVGAEQINIIKNPSFENVGEKELPSEWTGNFYGASKKGSIKINIKECHSGKNAVTISSLEDGTTGQFMSHQIAVKSGAVYKFNIWYKAQNVLRAQIRWFDEAGKNMVGLHVIEAPATQGEWKKLSMVNAIAAFSGAKNGKVTYKFEKVPTDFFLCPQEAKKMQLLIIQKNIGSITFDDVVFKLASENMDSNSELKRLLIGNDKTISVVKEKLIPDIQDVEIPVNYSLTKEKYPASATDIRSRDGIFYRGEKPVFLFGLESSTLAYPWQFRLLGMDIVHMNSTYELGVIRAKKQDKKLKIWWDEYKWGEVVAREILKSGLAVYIQPIESSNTNHHPVAKYFPEAFANTSHFVAYRFGDPIGDRLRKNYIKCFLKTFRKYPITIWETFNEVRYSDYSPLNIKDFRNSMKRKYKSISVANKAWGTEFNSFETVNPPKKSDSHGSRINILPKDFSQALWSDWGIFIENTFGKSLKDVASIYRKYNKNPDTYLTVQSYCDLPMGYSSLGGVNPYRKYESEDVYSHEDRGTVFYRQEAGAENIEEIKAMLLNHFVWNFLRKVSPDKPLLGVECHFKGGAPKKTDLKPLVDLHGNWKFMADNSRKGLQNGFAEPEYNDNDWKKIKVPGLWGTQGFAKCNFGWYRKKIFVPEEIKGGNIFINGWQLTDQAKIYLNGNLISETRNWNDQFAEDITEKLRYGKENTIAISISNSYFNGDMYWGGIRKYLSIDSKGFGKVYPTTAGQMRWWMWSRMLYGFSGAIISYAYSSDSSELSMFRPNKNSFASIRALPEIKNEMNSVASITMPRPRLKGKVAIVYPLEYGRYSVQDSPGEWLAAPLLKKLLNWYNAVLFSQVEIDVISCREIIEGKLDNYKLLLMPIAPLTPDEADSRIKEFVKGGGVLVASRETMTMSSENYAKKSNTWLFSGKTGKGKVYRIKSVPSYNETVEIIKKILKDIKIKPEVAVSGRGKTQYIETHLTGRKGRYVCTVFNWGGGGGDIKLHFNTLPKGKYNTRLLSSQEDIGTVENGTLAVKISSQKPIIILLEHKSLIPLPIEPISRRRKNLLKLWGPSKPGGTLVLLSSGMNEIIGRSRALTAMNLLEQNGYTLDFGLSRMAKEMKVFTDKEEVKDLDKYKVIVTLGSGLGGERTIADKEVKVISEYVKNGGSLFISANHFVGPHGWLSNSNKNAILKEFGVTALNSNIHSNIDYDFVPDYPAFTKISEHPVTSGVRKFQSHGMPEMIVKNPSAKVLIQSENGNPVLVALKYGKGRVVIVGDGKWLQPLPLAKADNAQLALNIFNWLARRPVTVLSKNKLNELVDNSFE